MWSIFTPSRTFFTVHKVVIAMDTLPLFLSISGERCSHCVKEATGALVQTGNGYLNLLTLTLYIISYMMLLVLDTNAVVAGLRSPTGASAALLDRALNRVFTPLVSVALALEYEAVCLDPKQRIASGLDGSEVRVLISALCAVARPVAPRFFWRPQLSDPADEMVLEAAINGRADGLVTFNQRDFGAVPARFGITLMSPREALWRISI